MKGSAYLAKQALAKQEVIHVAQRITQQLMLDTLQIAMHREFGFGYDRIKALTDAWGECYSEFFDALTGGMESDIVQEHLDRELRAIMGGKQPLIPFPERYPEIRRLGYDKLPKR